MMLRILITISSFGFALALSDCSNLPVRSTCTLPSDWQGSVNMAYYKKYVDAEGIKIMGADNVDDNVLVDAASVIQIIMRNIKPELRNGLVAKKLAIITYGAGESQCNLPELQSNDCKPSNGLGLSFGNRIMIPPINRGCQDKDAASYGFLIHEFGHQVNSVFGKLDATLQSKLQAAYNSAKQHTTWPADTYGMKTVAEYFPLCWTPYWFSQQRTCTDDESFCKRDKCRQRDSSLYAIVQSVVLPQSANVGLKCSDRCNPNSVRKESSTCGGPRSAHVRLMGHYRLHNVGTAADCWQKCVQDFQTNNCVASSFVDVAAYAAHTGTRFLYNCYLYRAGYKQEASADWTSYFK